MADSNLLKREARKYGATVERDTGGRHCTWQIVAPSGKRWIDNGAKSLRVAWVYGDAAWRNDEIQEALVRMSYGLRDG